MTTSGRRRGVVVGISDYSQVVSNSNLRFTVNDAERFFDLLCSKAGFTEEDLELFCDTPSDQHKAKAKTPSRANILSAINQMSEAAEEDDILVLFFAGHGVEIGGHPYLLSNDTKMDVVRDTAVDVSVLNGYLESTRAKCTLRIFDACRSGFSSARLLNPRMPRGLDEALLKTSKGWSTFSACSTGECAFEHPDLKQGVFTYYLCEGLEGESANDGGIVTWERLIDYVKISVANFCKSQSWVQTPHSVSDLSGTLEMVMIDGDRTKAEAIQPPTAATSVKTLQVELRSLIDSHLSEVDAPIRRFRLTGEEEISTVAEALKTAITGQIADFNHPSLRVLVPDKLDYSHAINMENRIKVSMQNAHTLGDYARNPRGFAVEFRSSELTLPSSILTFAVVRFKFFYWIWFWHKCIPSQKSLGWKPEPPEEIGYFTFSPPAILEVSTVEGVVQQILANGLQDLTKWAAQSRKYCEDWVQRINEWDASSS